MKQTWTSGELLASVLFGPLAPMDAWRKVWDMSEVDRQDIKGGVMFVRVKEIVGQLEAEDASAAALLAVDAMLKTKGAEVTP